MNQSLTTEWKPVERIVFRFTFSYLVFFFVFYSGFFVSNFAFVKYIHAPFEFISRHYVTFINNLIFHQRWDEGFSTTTGDTSAFAIASISYLFLALLVTITWTIFDKRNNYLKLYSILYIYARYYLAFVLFDYGFAKLTGNQFSDLHPDYLMRPLGNYNPTLLLWAYMSSSESYKIFTALIEVSAGALLLFRRTTAFGSAIALLSLVNILVINIGYDVLIKFFLVHLIVISLFILSPDFKRVLTFFLFKKATNLSSIPGLWSYKKLSWLKYTLKFGIIGLLIYLMLIGQLASAKINLPRNLIGLYNVKEFYINQRSLQLITDTDRWKKLAISRTGFITVQFLNDSTYGYRSKIDSINQSIDLIVWNDSTFKSKIHYTVTSTDEYLFEGTYKMDSIKVIAEKVDQKNLPINRTKGKVKWVWW